MDDGNGLPIFYEISSNAAISVLKLARKYLKKSTELPIDEKEIGYAMTSDEIKERIKQKKISRQIEKDRDIDIIDKVIKQQASENWGHTEG